jgi:hypothetical protein
MEPDGLMPLVACPPHPPPREGVRDPGVPPAPGSFLLTGDLWREALALQLLQLNSQKKNPERNRVRGSRSASELPGGGQLGNDSGKLAKPSPSALRGVK